MVLGAAPSSCFPPRTEDVNAGARALRSSSRPSSGASFPQSLQSVARLRQPHQKCKRCVEDAVASWAVQSIHPSVRGKIQFPIGLCGFGDGFLLVGDHSRHRLANQQHGSAVGKPRRWILAITARVLHSSTIPRQAQTTGTSSTRLTRIMATERLYAAARVRPAPFGSMVRWIAQAGCD